MPNPKTNGYYSSTLDSEYEMVMTKQIQREAPRKIDSSNAGRLLSIIWSRADKLADLPRRPPYLSRLEQCNDYVKQRPKLLSLLAVVHKKKAYVWLCENCMQ